MMKLGLAACAAFALTATAASANGFWQNGTYYTYAAPTTTTTQTYTAPSYTTPSYTAPSYTAPSYTGVVGSVGPVETSPYVAPAPTYVVPSNTRTYVAPTTTYAPVTTYAPAAPVYSVPAYAPAPQYDGRDNVRRRIQNQRSRIERALERGDLRRGEERRLREGLREIRRTFRDYRDNDGYIGRYEEAALMRMLDQNGRRIRRLANNDRVAGDRGDYRRGRYAN